MVKEYTQKELEEFVKGMKKISRIIHSKKPDFIFAPITGAVPFIDVLNIVDRYFPLNSVEYPPNSSRFFDRNNLLYGWNKNFLEENYFGERIKIVSLDEVLSGSSASAGYNQFRRAIDSLIMERAGSSLEREDSHTHHLKKINKDIGYEILGIAERRRRNHNFSRLLNQKKAHLVEVPLIIPLDDVALNTVRLKVDENACERRQRYLPQIAKFETTPEYLSFLQDVASFVGVDPSTVGPVNFGRISESLSKYLSRPNSSQ